MDNEILLRAILEELKAIRVGLGIDAAPAPVRVAKRKPIVAQQSPAEASAGLLHVCPCCRAAVIPESQGPTWECLVCSSIFLGCRPSIPVAISDLADVSSCVSCGSEVVKTRLLSELHGRWACTKCNCAGVCRP